MSAEEESPGKKSSRRRVVLEVRRALCGGRFRAISLIVFLIFDPSFFFFSVAFLFGCVFFYIVGFFSFLFYMLSFIFGLMYFFLVYHHSFLFLFCFFVSFIVHFFLSFRSLIPRWGLTAVEVREALRGYINKHDRPFDSSKAYVSYQNYWPLKKIHSGAG